MSAVAASRSAQEEKQQQAAAKAPAAQARAATLDAAPVAVKDRSDSEPQLLSKQLGLSQDVSPAGLIAAANSLGLGASSSAGTPLPPQVREEGSGIIWLGTCCVFKFVLHMRICVLFLQSFSVSPPNCCAGKLLACIVMVAPPRP